MAADRRRQQSALVTLDDLRAGQEDIRRALALLTDAVAALAKRLPAHAPTAPPRDAPDLPTETPRREPETASDVARKKARDDGYAHGRRGGFLRDNPFQRCDPRHYAWKTGLVEGREQRAVSTGQRGGVLPSDQRAARAEARERKARARGYDAAMAGEPESACPYRTATGGFRNWWHEGYADGLMARRQGRAG